MSFTIGSLFDGSGGFPLAASMCGGVPKWASEIEPYPIAVTKSRFPNMKHLGSVTDINGGEVEPVDIITFGSPCQDLSVAGKRAGLKHEDNGDEETTRSGLFMEAIRIIKEMRRATNGAYPRFAIWENVPGAFSSNKGEDFRTVLQELIKIVEPSAVMPAVPKNGWPYADCYCGDGWSIAYRTVDAQYWGKSIRDRNTGNLLKRGTPQRRRRIYLVADFRGECAGKVSFEREGLRGYFETGGTPWQTVAGNAEAGFGTADCEGKGVVVPYTWKIRSGCEGGGKGALIQEDKSATLATNNYQHLFQPIGIDSYNLCETGYVGRTLSTPCGGLNEHIPCVYYSDATGVDVYNQTLTGDKAKTLNSAATDADHIPCTVYSVENHPADSRVNTDDSGKVLTLTSRMGTGGGNVPMVMEPMLSAGFKPNQGAKAQGIGFEVEVSPTLLAGQEPGVVYCLQGNGIDRADTAGCNGKGVKEDICYTLNTIDRPAVVYACSSKQQSLAVSEDMANTLGANDYKEPQVVAFQTYQKVTGPLMANSHPGSYTGQDAFSDMLVAGPYQEKVGALRSTDYKWVQQQQVEQDKLIVEQQNIRYIVRRLTPTECARLQGFADRWAVPDRKEDFTDEEYKFWCKVYLTKLMIDGKVENDENGDLVYTTSRKPFKQKTKEQMLKWYNGLHTDSSEYKMWGNGIALPCALFIMSNIADVLAGEKAARKKWLDDLLGDCL